MGSFLDAAVGFPGVIFTILLVPVVLYWITVLLGAIDLDLGGDTDVEVELDTDIDADADIDAVDAGLLAGVWSALGLTAVPVTLAGSLVVVFGWFVAVMGTAAADAADLSGPALILAGLGTILVALVAGTLAASVTARPLARLFVSVEAEGRSAFVGRVCTIRTNEVTDSFGQAEATDPSGATVLLQVRTAEPLDLRYGNEALIVDYEGEREIFLVTPYDLKD